MHYARCALVVAATPTLARHVFTWLKPRGWHVIIEDSYRAARVRLDQGADLLITELELGDYNGLQLALRARGQQVPAVVIGHPDPVLERDAEQLGSLYLRKDELDQQRLLLAVELKMEMEANALPMICRNLHFARHPHATRGHVLRRMLLH